MLCIFQIVVFIHSDEEILSFQFLELIIIGALLSPPSLPTRKRLFSRVHATLELAVSEGRKVGHIFKIWTFYVN